LRSVRVDGIDRALKVALKERLQKAVSDVSGIAGGTKESNRSRLEERS
jgi:hypothetical protein